LSGFGLFYDLKNRVLRIGSAAKGFTEKVNSAGRDGTPGRLRISAIK
jgi:hypothetical protein